MCGGTPNDWPDVREACGLSPRVRGNLNRVQDKANFPGSIPACAGEPLAHGPNEVEERVYPRVCGGTIEKYREDVLAAGLSPRVRGNHAPPPAGAS